MKGENIATRLRLFAAGVIRLTRRFPTALRHGISSANSCVRGGELRGSPRRREPCGLHPQTRDRSKRARGNPRDLDQDSEAPRCGMAI